MKNRAELLFVLFLGLADLGCDQASQDDTDPVPDSGAAAEDANRDAGPDADMDTDSDADANGDTDQDAGADGGSTYVQVEIGDLPIVLSAPHGGTLVIPGVPERTTGTTTMDTNTYELAIAIQNAIEARTGASAHLVAALASRKYVDFNREAAEAYEDPAVAPVYRAYHTALSIAVEAATAAAGPGALLVDLHGQSFNVLVAYRGTRNGETADLGTLHADPGGFLTAVMASGVSVSPATAGGFENPSFNGGYIVATYGRGAADGINAVQLEFGMSYRRTSSDILETASDIADGLVAHLDTFAEGF